ncbi:hypothetical protein CFB82_41270 [Burkholderia sp. HI2714]|uniref:hypothetical protein n=1 Tax=Burkholderia sp. HI2714 TaxID=2015359 RepID=UPI000B79C630|nr:hypothetical protein [Burkholderia sp. HI2714]OXJ21447.1 hypothetical protein CFB82_41270 [Burkholderia sp. HI2714]
MQALKTGAQKSTRDEGTALTARMPSPDEILARFRPGFIYEPYDMARKFGVRPRMVSPILESMAGAGQLEVAAVKRGKRLYRGYALLGTVDDGAEEVKASTTSIAARPIGPNLKSTLAGYDREMRSRMALCIMVRQALNRK